jgi:hypothetical protein
MKSLPRINMTNTCQLTIGHRELEAENKLRLSTSKSYDVGFSPEKDYST